LRELVGITMIRNEKCMQQKARLLSLKDQIKDKTPKLNNAC
jgi:hypothetical protein